MDLMFFVNSVLFGIGLAMDAFSVSLAQGLNEPNMRFPRECGIAGTFAVFQTMMPLLGWFLVRKMEQVFSAFQLLIPWAALALLLFIGGKMLYEGLRNPDGESVPLHVSRFFPRFQMTDRPATPVRKVYRLAEVAREALPYVYTGNC